jgi:hypothetical protein
VSGGENERLVAKATTPMLRWSSVRACPRKAVYEATGSPARERTDREERILFRGKSIGRDYASFLAAKHGADAIQAERKVQWPLGIGHIDVYLKQTKTAIEVLSSAHASDDMVQSKLLQLTGYIEHDPYVENGVLVVLNPSDFWEERYIVNTETEAYAELVAEMHARIDKVLAWRDTGEIPARVCGKPSDAWGHFCLHAEHCFEGWTKPEIVPNEDPLVHELSINLYRAKQDEHAAKERVTEHEEKRKAIQAQLAEHLEEGEHEIGSLTIKRTVVNRKPTLDLKKALLAGAVTPDALEPYMKDGATYSTWYVDRHGDAPLVIPGEFGDEAPWTDDDLKGPWDDKEEAA